MEKFKTLGIIPARGGSKRVPGKNKKKLNGKELVRYAIEACLDSKNLSTIVVSSDDVDILEIAQSYEGVIAIDRPEHISGDRAEAITYVQHAVELLDENYDFTAIIQPSSPFTSGADIDKTIDLLIKSPNADSSVSVMKLDHAIHPIKMKTMDDDLLNPFIEEEQGRMAEHELPEIYVRNCSVYVSRIESISKGKIIGDHCLGYIMPRERSIDINDNIDFDFAEFMMKKK